MAGRTRPRRGRGSRGPQRPAGPQGYEDSQRPYGHESRQGYEGPPAYDEHQGYGGPRHAGPPHSGPQGYGGPQGYDERQDYDEPPDDEVESGRPRRGRRPARRSGRGGGRGGSLPPVAYFVAAGVIVLVAVVAVAAVVVFGGGSGGGGGQASAPQVKNVRAEGPGASAYSHAASTAAFAPIADRAKDARPLTPGQVFGTKKITDADAKASLKLTASSLDAQCTSAIWGTRLAGRLAQGGCTQAARATYSDKNFAALVTIFNLADARAADQVVADADPRSDSGFPLAPSGSPAFGQGFSTARGVAMGHYAVITWVQHADGSGDEQDAALLSLLVTTGRPNAVLVRATGQSSHQ